MSNTRYSDLSMKQKLLVWFFVLIICVIAIVMIPVILIVFIVTVLAALVGSIYSKVTRFIGVYR